MDNLMALNLNLHSGWPKAIEHYFRFFSRVDLTWFVCLSVCTFVCLLETTGLKVRVPMIFKQHFFIF